MKSFVQSLPSQRKKEKVRKSRHQKSRSSRGHRGGSISRRSGYAAASGRGDTDESSRGNPEMPQSQSPGSIVEATEVQCPPLPARMGFASRGTVWNAKGGFEDGKEADAENHPDGSSEETTLSQTQGTVVEATQFQYPPPKMADTSARKPGGTARMGRVGRRQQKTRPQPDIMPSPVHSSLAVSNNCGAEYDKAYDEETVGILTPPLSERKERLEPETNSGPGDEALNCEATKPLYCGECKDNVEQDQKVERRHNTSRQGMRSAERNLSLETEPRCNLGSKGREPIETSEFENKKAEEETIDTSLAHNSSRGTNHSERVHRNEKEESVDERSTHGELTSDEDKELLLTASDIGDCIKAISSSKQITERFPSHDYFHNIDLDQWQTTFEDFEKYIVALGNPGSAEAEELQQISTHDKVYAIFDRGMDVNDCNALFIYNMIHTMSDGIDAYGKRHPHPAPNLPIYCKSYNEKLNHLAACLDMIFRVSGDSHPSAASIAMSILKSDRENSTVLKLSKSLRANQDGELPASTIQQPIPSTMPPHLKAMSQVFAQFASENTRPLQSQLDSTRKTLAVTREGAMDLQRQALKLQDDLQDAQTEAMEAKARRKRADEELERLKYEFQRREESFERVKEHYKAEIDRKEQELVNVKDQHGRELQNVRAESATAKHGFIERRAGRRVTDHRKRKENRSDKQTKDQSEHHMRRMNPSTANVNEETTDDVEISPSVPRKIDYGLDDAEESGKRIKRHSTGNVTSRKSYPYAPYELRPPRKLRASPEPKVTDKKQKTDYGRTKSKYDRVDEPDKKQKTDYGCTKRKYDRVDEHSSRIRQLGGVKQRNPLKSLTDNSPVDNAVKVNHREKMEPRIRRERSRMNNQGVEGEDVNKTSSNFVSSTKHEVTKNPYLKQSKPANKAANNEDPTFAYQEVVRGRDKRQALPGHDCEECRKFLDALGKGYDTREMVMECSRHRARHVPPSTPPDFWKLTFVDSVSSETSAD